MRSSYMTVLIGACLLGMGCAQDAPMAPAATDSTMARPLVRQSPRYPPRVLHDGGEGIVLLSFVVQTDGTTRDVLVLRSLGHRDFETAAVEVVETWTYSPATRKGVPIEDAFTRVLIPFRVEGRGSGKQELGASRDFIRDYRKVHGLVAEQRFEEALQAMQPLERSTGLSLYEGARLNLLKAFIFETLDRDAELYEVLSEATLLDGENVEDRHHLDALATMARLSIKDDRYGDAANQLERLAEASGDAMPKHSRRLADEVERLRVDPHPYTVEAQITMDPTRADSNTEGPATRGIWWVSPLRSKFSIQAPQDGHLDTFSLRCHGHVEEGQIDFGRIFELSDEWGDCMLFVWGTPGTVFGFVEGG